MAYSLKRGGPMAPTRAARLRRHLRVRKKINGTTVRPRLVVTRSNRHVFASVVDDSVMGGGQTLASASTLELRGSDTGNKTVQAKSVGSTLATRAIEAGVTTVVFERGGMKYQGRIAALADGAREAGLEF